MRLAILSVCSVSIAAAQSASTPVSIERHPETRPAIFAPTSPVPAANSPPPRPQRQMSPALSANVTSVVRRDLAASVPTPAPAPAPTAIVGDTAPGTVRLAPFRVHDDRTPKISASDILTTAGKIALARKRYPGLVGPGSAGLALQLYEQDLLVAQREELIEDGALLTFDHPEASKAEKRKIYDTLLGTRHQGP